MYVLSINSHNIYRYNVDKEAGEMGIDFVCKQNNFPGALCFQSFFPFSIRKTWDQFIYSLRLCPMNCYVRTILLFYHSESSGDMRYDETSLDAAVISHMHE